MIVDEFAHKIALREVLADATAVKFPVDAVEQLISPQGLVIIQVAEAPNVVRMYRTAWCMQCGSRACDEETACGVAIIVEVGPCQFICVDIKL